MIHSIESIQNRKPLLTILQNRLFHQCPLLVIVVMMGANLREGGLNG